MDKLYVLKLENDKYYVGKTQFVAQRYKQHLEGSGAAWTKKYKPVKLMEVRDMKTDHDETNLTKDLMKKYGVENVRGGAYAQVNLDDSVKNVLEMEIRGNADACFKCGGFGHFARDCDEEEEEEEVEVWTCDYCDREFVTEDAAFKHEKRCGGQLGYADSKSGVCYRCGRSSHYANECYATRHVKGYELD